MKLSICCITYNHENYIKDALESFLSQNIDFKYEIIIGDDLSTDNTRNIISDYQKRYPNIIKPIFRNENIGVMKNFKDTLSKATGEYIAYCDGDDYWIDINKIKMQIHALENNPTCSYSFHDTKVISNVNEFLYLLSKGRRNERFQEGIIKSSVVIGSPIRIIHANSLVFKRLFMERELNLLNKLTFSPNGDFALTMILASQGDGYYFKKAMGTYRINPNSISNNRSLLDPKTFNQLMNFYNVINIHFNYKFRKELSNNVIGTKISYFESLLSLNIKNKKYVKSFLVLLKMIYISKNSQYSIRDILWIFRKQIGLSQ